MLCASCILYIYARDILRKAQCPFIHSSCCGQNKTKQNKKNKKNNNKQNCWILQNPPVKDNSPSPIHSDIKMVTFSPTLQLQSPPSQVCEGFFFYYYYFSLLRCLTPVPPCFPSKTFLFAPYISALSPVCPLFFNMSIFLSFLFHFLPTYPSPILSLSQF